MKIRAIKVIIGMLFTFITLLMSDTFVLNPPKYYPIQLEQEASITPTQGINYRIKTPLIVSVGSKRYTVPEGFITDLASIPRPLWVFIAPEDEGFVFPAILHDYLYSCPAEHSRKYIDAVFYSFLQERGISWLTSSEFYMAVRLFGESHFNKGNYCITAQEPKHDN